MQSLCVKPDKVVWWLVFELSLTSLVLQVPAHAQQQQDVHGEQVEGEQQRRALTGAEGHSQHPHQAGAAVPRLRGERGRRSARFEANPVLVQLHNHSYYDGKRGAQCSSPTETYASDGSVWRLDEDGGVGLFVLLCRPPFSLAVTNNHKNKQTSAVRCSHQNQQQSNSSITQL